MNDSADDRDGCDCHKGEGDVLQACVIKTFR